MSGATHLRALNRLYGLLPPANAHLSPPIITQSVAELNTSMRQLDGHRIRPRSCSRITAIENQRLPAIYALSLPDHGAEFIMAKKDPTPVTILFPAALVRFTSDMIIIDLRGGPIPDEFGPAWQPFFKTSRWFYRTEYRTPKDTLGGGCETATAYDETPDANGRISITATKSGWLDMREVPPKALFKHGKLFKKVP